MNLHQVKTDVDADRFIEDACNRAQRVGAILYDTMGINPGLAEDATINLLLSGDSLDKCGDAELAELVAKEMGVRA
jgi:hypothetical protein